MGDVEKLGGSASNLPKQVNTIFNRLRARLFNVIEGGVADKTVCDAMKKSVRDYTSQAWNDIITSIKGE